MNADYAQLKNGEKIAVLLRQDAKEDPAIAQWVKQHESLMTRRVDSEAYRALDIDASQANANIVKEVERISNQPRTDIEKGLKAVSHYVTGRFYQVFDQREQARESFIKMQQLKDDMAIWDTRNQRLDRVIKAIDDASNSGNSVSEYKKLAQQWQAEFMRDDMVGETLKPIY